MPYTHTLGGERHHFEDLRTLLAKASPPRSGDHLAGVAAVSARERVAAQHALAELPLARFLHEAVVPYEDDEVTRLIVDTHDSAAFAPVAALTVGDFRDWLLSDAADTAALAALAPGLMPEMAAAVSKLCRLQDLMLIARKCTVATRFRSTIGLPRRLATRLQPNHPTDDAAGIAASLLDGLLHGAGDAVIGINPATDNLPQVMRLLQMLDGVIARYAIPTQSCVLTHMTNTLAAIERGAPVDLVFQSIGGTEGTNRGFGVDLALLAEAQAAALALKRGARFVADDGGESIGDHVMYFETGQGSALSAGAHHGCDQQTIEARAYGVARRFRPLLVNSVVGFIGPEYLYDGKQIARAGLEDHCCGKLLGVPMGVDVCYTNHAEADGDDTDALLTMLAAAGCNFVMGVPGADDIMLNYQSTSFHDALAMRELLGLRCAPEFEDWLAKMGIVERGEGALPRLRSRVPEVFAAALKRIEGAGVTEPALPVTPQDWRFLRRYTDARIALGRAGRSVPTAAQLDFAHAHAQARDAVHLAFDVDATEAALHAQGLETRRLHSAAPDRGVYLQRPDLGRRLDEASRAKLVAGDFDLAFVVADGLSALAIHRNAAPLIEAVLLRLRSEGGWGVAPIALVEQGRVAIGDEIGAALGARCVAVLIGERPGLSSPDSLGIYLTWAPRVGLADSARNCISNVRAAGLAVDAAAAKLHQLLSEARRLGLSGIGLKDDRDDRAEAIEAAASRGNFLLGS